MIQTDCSVLIHSRTKNCEFKSKFLVRPDDFLDSHINKYKKMVLQTTTSIWALPSDECRKIVIGDDNHIICGVTADIRFFTKFNENLNTITQDKFGRSVYLFAGIVIKRSNLTNDFSFPSNESLAQLIEKYVSPRWLEEDNTESSKHSTISAYSETVQDTGNAATVDSVQFNHSPSRMRVFPHSQSEKLVQSFMSAVRTERTSLCVNFSHEEDAKISDFTNVTIDNIDNTRDIWRTTNTSPYARQRDTTAYNTDTNPFNTPRTVNLYDIHTDTSHTDKPNKKEHLKDKLFNLSGKASSVQTPPPINNPNPFASQTVNQKYMIAFDLYAGEKEAERTLFEIKNYLEKFKNTKNTQIIKRENKNNF